LVKTEGSQLSRLIFLFLLPRNKKKCLHIFGQQLKHQKLIHYGFDHYNLVKNNYIYSFNYFILVREDVGLAKFEEILEQERRRYVEKGFFVIFKLNFSYINLI